MSSTRAVQVTPAFTSCARAFEEEFDYLYRALRRFGVRPADAEDLVQDVFLVMCRRWADYDPERPLRPWLAGIAFRVAHDFRKRAGRETPIGFVNPTDETPDAEERLHTRHARTLVAQALASLPDKQRHLIVLHDFEGRTIREIADAIALPIFTTYARVRKAHQAFAKAVRRLQTIASVRAGQPERLAAAIPTDTPSADRKGSDDRRSRSRSRTLGLLAAAGAASQSTEVSAARPRPSAIRQAARGGGLGLRLVVPLAVGAAVGVTALWAVLPRSAPATHPRAAETMALTSGGPTGARTRGKPPLTRLGHPLASPTRPTDADAATIGQGLVGYWRLDDSEGSASARDLSGSGNDCVLRGADPATGWVEGNLGGALNLGGAAWLECARTEALERLSGEITVAAWVARGRTQRVLDALVTRQAGSGTGDQFFFGFYKGKLMVTSSVWGKGVSARFPRAPGEWTHVAFAHHRDGVTQLFIDGVEVDRKQGQPASLHGETRPLIIGGGVNGGDQSRASELFAGALDEVLVYDRALGDREVAALASGKQPSLSL